MSEQPADLTVLEPGAEVLVGDDIEATVNAVTIYRGLAVQYSCTWWNGRTTEEKWLPEHMVKAIDKSETLKIGF